ncbi:MAG: C40 family peptidase [Candidatus Omnitrophica bacterium]|nr:C40 family peptidase [Candidatus Omnitrophota bacterium]
MSCWLAGCAASRSMMAVNATVLDVRAQPETIIRPGLHDPLQETQLLYGERVRVLTTRRGWAWVEAIEQPEFSHNTHWQGYPGWVPASSLVPWDPLMRPTIVVTEKWVQAWDDAFTLTASQWRFPLGARLRATEMGGHLWNVELLDGTIVWIPATSARSLAELRALPVPRQRQLILQHAQLLVGDEYVWGGRSPHLEGTGRAVTGVDCSGLINLAYRAAGIDIPRDAHEQFLRAKPIAQLQPADVIFLSERANPRHIVHVMLYAGAGDVIEGPGTGLRVRRVALTARFGLPLDQVRPGAVIEGQTVFFGAYLPQSTAPG